MAVAAIVAELGLDAPTVAAALLHDAVEDTGLNLAAIGDEFGPVVANVVDGVTKLDRLQFDLEGWPSRPPRSAKCSWPWPTTGG